MTKGGSLEKIRQAVGDMVGVRAKIRVGRGGSGGCKGRKGMVCVGQVDATYANVFTVRAEGRRDRLCFSYGDVLTQGVSLVPLRCAAREDAWEERGEAARGM